MNCLASRTAVSVKSTYLLIIPYNFPITTKGVYTSKSGSKSFDELDDILGEKVKNKNSGSPHSSMMDDTSRHSCDELMMTRSLYEAETSDTASQVCSNVRWVMEFLTRGYKNSFITLKRNPFFIS